MPAGEEVLTVGGAIGQRRMRGPWGNTRMRSTGANYITVQDSLFSHSPQQSGR